MPFPAFFASEWAVPLIELRDPPARRQCTQDSNHVPETWSVHGCASGLAGAITIETPVRAHPETVPDQGHHAAVHFRSSVGLGPVGTNQRHRADRANRHTGRPLLRQRTCPIPRRHAGHRPLRDAQSPASEPSRWPHRRSGSVRFVDPSRPQQRFSCSSAAGSLREPIISRVCTHQQHLAVGRRTASCSAPLNRRATPVTRLPAGQQNWQTFHIPPVCVPTRSSVSESSTPF